MNTIILDAIDITAFLKAQKKFKEFIQDLSTEKDKAAAIQAFEYCYELSWKTLKRVLKEKGAPTPQFSKDIFRQAALQKIIDSPEIWFNFGKLRNETSHTYNEEVLEKIAAILPSFEKELDSLTKRLLKLK
jgi:nucleotidyltransferase substrate binding protein (TIGR01987 family)